jgi:hypothetical protein
MIEIVPEPDPEPEEAEFFVPSEIYRPDPPPFIIEWNRYYWKFAELFIIYTAYFIYYVY